MSSRGRILSGFGVVDVNLMIAEIKNSVFRMKFIIHQRHRDFGCAVALNFFSCPTIAPNTIHESAWTIVYVTSLIAHFVLRPSFPNLQMQRPICNKLTIPVTTKVALNLKLTLRLWHSVFLGSDFPPDDIRREHSNFFTKNAR
jgi:hypothetical protein